MNLRQFALLAVLALFAAAWTNDGTKHAPLPASVPFAIQQTQTPVASLVRHQKISDASGWQRGRFAQLDWVGFTRDLKASTLASDDIQFGSWNVATGSCSVMAHREIREVEFCLQRRESSGFPAVDYILASTAGTRRPSSSSITATFASLRTSRPSVIVKCAPAASIDDLRAFGLFEMPLPTSIAPGSYLVIGSDGIHDIIRIDEYDSAFLNIDRSRTPTGYYSVTTPNSTWHYFRIVQAENKPTRSSTFASSPSENELRFISLLVCGRDLVTASNIASMANDTMNDHVREFMARQASIWMKSIAQGIRHAADRMTSSSRLTIRPIPQSRR